MVDVKIVNGTIRRVSRRGRREEAGQSLVEMAVVLPILLALVVGIFEFGRAWNVHQVLVNAAREGARKAVIPTSLESDVHDTIGVYLGSAGLDPEAGEISISGMDDGIGNPTTVRIAYPHEFAFLGPVVSLLSQSSEIPSGTVTLKTAVVMRNE